MRRRELLNYRTILSFSWSVCLMEKIDIFPSVVLHYGEPNVSLSGLVFHNMKGKAVKHASSFCYRAKCFIHGVIHVNWRNRSCLCWCRVCRTRCNWPSDPFSKLTNVMRGCTRLFMFPYCVCYYCFCNIQLFCTPVANVQAQKPCRLVNIRMYSAEWQNDCELTRLLKRICLFLF
jgi:hypothetical protein